MLYYSCGKKSSGHHSKHSGSRHDECSKSNNIMIELLRASSD